MSFPSSLPSIATSNADDTLAVMGHASKHNAMRDEILALATKVGVDSSAVTSTHDYKIRTLETNLTNYEASSSAALTAAVVAVKETLYPVGSVYSNATDATNPGTLLGFGTWTAFGAGKVMVGLNSGDADFNTPEETGGAKTHTLSSAEMPSHTHIQDAHNHTSDQGTGATGSGNFSLPSANNVYPNNYATNATTAVNQNTGGGGAHNNLQPYIVVYMWKRTA